MVSISLFLSFSKLIYYLKIAMFFGFLFDMHSLCFVKYLFCESVYFKLVWLSLSVLFCCLLIYGYFNVFAYVKIEVKSGSKVNIVVRTSWRITKSIFPRPWLQARLPPRIIKTQFMMLDIASQDDAKFRLRCIQIDML